MTVQEILIWPNPELLHISEPVDTITDDIRTLVDDMFETMYAHDGVGLAAPQIGVKKRILVVDIHSPDAERPSGEDPIVMINPVFTRQEGALEWEEGCLSVPGETGKVTRAADIEMTFMDLNGETQTLTADGLTAVALQHEVDHLDGKLFVAYLSPMKRKIIKRKMLKLIKSREEHVHGPDCNH